MGRITDLVRRLRPNLVDTKWALVGGLLATLIALAGLTAVGTVSGFEARGLLDATLPSLRFLTSTIATASASILALMVTVLALTHALEHDMDEIHYRRIQQISWMAALAIAASVTLLLFLSIPLGESEEVVREWYDWVYYAVIVVASALGGLLVSLVLMLLKAVQGLVRVMAPHIEHQPRAEPSRPEEPGADAQ